VFRELIQEARRECRKKRRKIKDLDERPEVSTASEFSLPRRGLEKTQPYGDPGARTNHQQSLHGQNPT
jgi:hypothetical protein